MLEIILLLYKQYHPLMMDATKRSIQTFCPVSSTIKSSNFPTNMEKCFVIEPGDIFVRCPYNLLDMTNNFSYINLDVVTNQSGTYYSREVSDEFRFKESPIFYNKTLGDPVGTYIKEPYIIRLKCSEEVLDEQLKLNKQININKYFYNDDSQEVSFEFRR